MRLSPENLRSLIKEELSKLFEQDFGGGFWINRFGNINPIKQKAHREELAQNPRQYFTEDQLERMDGPTLAAKYEHLAYQNGCVRVRDNTHFTLNQRNIKGLRTYIRQYLDKLIADDNKRKYYVDVLGKDGKEIKQEYENLTLSEFMEEFSKRKKGKHTSKITRFR